MALSAMQFRTSLRPAAAAAPRQGWRQAPATASCAPTSRRQRQPAVPVRASQGLAPGPAPGKRPASSPPPQQPSPAPAAGERIRGVLQLALGGLAISAAAALGGVLIQDYSTLPCQLTPEGCQAIPLFMKVPLIATHFFTFLLIPATMYVFYTRASALKDAGAQDPFVAMLGLAFVMVAIAGEMGWHVTQEWFYVEDYSILNFFFYFFLMTGTSAWAIGIKEDDTTTSLDEKVDLLLVATPWLAGLAYLAGAAVLHTKVPIYGLLSVQYAVLTYRFWNLLKTPKVFLFPFFSVGVNLFFIAQLNAHKADPILNPLFHILHDAAGTELGVAVIATLIFLQLPADAQGPQLPALPGQLSGDAARREGS